MSGPLRSKKGCWTCRLRKKKCDEGRPYCSTCESLFITCYGFGAKPDWMGDKVAERKVSESFKKIVKQTSKRKTINQRPRRSEAMVRAIAPKSSSGAMADSLSGPRSSHRRTSGSPLVETSHYQQDEPIVSNIVDWNYNARDSDAQQDSSSGSGSGDGHSADISIPLNDHPLLMHFLDIVFPLQYPMYKPGILEGGRGWLLTLLLQSNPFYHSALALSAYHRRIVMPANTVHSHKTSTLIQQEEHYKDCIHSLKQATQNSCPKSGLGVVAATMQLAFFEACRSH